MKHILLLGAIGALAMPVCTLAQTQAPSLSSMIGAVETKGYTVTGVDVDRNTIEVDATAADGRRMELDLDPATGAITREQPDD